MPQITLFFKYVCIAGDSHKKAIYQAYCTEMGVTFEIAGIKPTIPFYFVFQRCKKVKLNVSNDRKVIKMISLASSCLLLTLNL